MCVHRITLSKPSSAFRREKNERRESTLDGRISFGRTNGESLSLPPDILSLFESLSLSQCCPRRIIRYFIRLTFSPPTLDHPRGGVELLFRFNEPSSSSSRRDQSESAHSPSWQRQRFVFVLANAFAELLTSSIRRSSSVADVFERNAHRQFTRPFRLVDVLSLSVVSVRYQRSVGQGQVQIVIRQSLGLRSFRLVSSFRRRLSLLQIDQHCAVSIRLDGIFIPAELRQLLDHKRPLHLHVVTQDAFSFESNNASFSLLPSPSVRPFSFQTLCDDVFISRTRMR